MVCIMIINNNPPMCVITRLVVVPYNIILALYAQLEGVAPHRKFHNNDNQPTTDIAGDK